MAFRFYENPETGEPHIHDHGVTEEVRQVFQNPGVVWIGRNETTVRLARTDAGRLLQVPHVVEADGVFVLTAYEPNEATAKSFRRRRKTKP